ncbi:gluconate 2-dehydrogenase subunit 3 family protein [Roseomonas sp. OT10]|uniref:gluconate 2-dehydrogenase subunit 3 family protein n=1 Tax=Roseomonas cutis TaxID=2897332 RepID=UPI001E5D7FFE|nr:gluconate 2-dehydrogenase subunit 3 family protein [Roseomonas sp. OT10]UFN49552.1 gluconate 2-dehydrogenase subunit 3 family protein [Roseomonas sp. OT10]
MRVVDKRLRASRRGFLRGAALGLPAAALTGALLEADAAWAAEAVNLPSRSMVMLAKLARDIFPHDRVPDRFYVAAVWPYDAKAGQDADLRTLFQDGLARLDAAAKAKYGGNDYLSLNWERDRLPLLNEISDTPFFRKLRGDLVVSLYNQEELWPKFGYEGSSAEYGGYLHRGFDDIDWLPAS